MRGGAAGSWLITFSLTAALPIYALAATDSGDAQSQSRIERKSDQSGAKPDSSAEQTDKKTDGQAGAKSEAQPDDKGKDKPGEKSADKPGDNADESGDKSEQKPDDKSADKPDDFWKHKSLLGDIDGLRPALQEHGMTLGIVDTDEVLGNITGGRKQGAIYEGLTDLSLSTDFKPATRGILLARAYQIRGRGLSSNYLDNLDTMSGIEAMRTTRLVELWYEQHFDFWRIRVGQQTIGTEFLSPASARLFVNGAFGWPTLPSVNLPSGGPGYPLGTPAVRVRIDPIEGLTLFTAVFNGDPTGAGVGGSQLNDASGTAFRVGDGAFVISEIRYNEGSSDHKGTYRFGGWFNSEQFPDRHFDTTGLSLASPASNGRPLLRRGDYSFYAIVDQPFFDKDSKTGIAVFARAMGAPGDRNPVSFYADAGVIYNGPFDRKNDKAGLALGYARVGQAARNFDADVARFTGQAFPVRSGEALLELTYSYQLAGWWQVQPDFQYIFNPGGGIPNPITPNRRIGDAAVLGIRSVLTF
jgi:porin